MVNITEPRIEKMRQSLRTPEVALLKYNKLKSQKPDMLIFVFEGYEDPIFYSVLVSRCNFKHAYSPLVVEGKDMVLGLRQLLQNSCEANLKAGVAFFIDNDFDGLKNYDDGSDIYCTPTYSIENIAVTTSVLEQLLTHEFRLHDPDLKDDIKRNVKAYEKLIDDFTKK